MYQACSARLFAFPTSPSQELLQAGGRSYVPTGTNQPNSLLLALSSLSSAKQEVETNCISDMGVSSSRRSSHRTTHAITRSSSTPTSRPRCTPSLGPHALCWTCAAPPARRICSSRSMWWLPGSPRRMKAAKGEVEVSNRRWVSAHLLCLS